MSNIDRMPDVMIALRSWCNSNMIFNIMSGCAKNALILYDPTKHKQSIAVWYNESTNSLVEASVTRDNSFRIEQSIELADESAFGKLQKKLLQFSCLK